MKSFYFFIFVNITSAGLLDALKGLKKENPICKNSVLGYRYKNSKCVSGKTSVSDWLGGQQDDDLSRKLAADMEIDSEFGSYIRQRQNQKQMAMQYLNV